MPSAVAHAAWGYSGNPLNAGTTGVTITAASVLSVTDGAHGLFTCWSDDRNGNYDVFLQHMDVNGNIVSGWSSSGLNLCAVSGDQVSPRLAPDGSGGVVVIWQDERSGSTGKDIYGVRITGAGAVASGWTTDGSTINADPTDQVEPDVVQDGTGGFIVAWRNTAKIFAKRITGSNGAVWTDSASTSTTGLSSPRVVADGSGGGIVVYRASSRVFGQRFRESDGDRLWTGSSDYPQVAPIDTTGSVTEDPSIVTDGAGGVLVAYTTGDILLKRVTSGGSVWSSPLTVCNAANTQFRPRIASDAAGGAIIAWADYRGGYSEPEVYVQRVRGGINYAACLTANGVGVFSNTSTDAPLAIEGDGQGGAHVVMCNQYYVFVRHLKRTGVLDYSWSITDLSSTKVAPSVLVTRPDSTLVSWRDSRNSKHGVYANYGLYSTTPSAPTGLSTLSITQSCYDTIAVSWTGPADDATYGAATSFLLKWSTAPITESNFLSSDGVEIATTGGSGTSYTLRAGSLQSCTGYYFAIRTRRACQLSAISNVPSGSTLCTPGICGQEKAPSVGVTDPPGASIAEIELGPPSPSPTSDRLVARFGFPALAEGMPYSLAVFDLVGRRIRTLQSGSAAVGRHSVGWDLREESGRRVQGGVYYMRLTVGAETITRTLVIQR